MKKIIRSAVAAAVLALAVAAPLAASSSGDQRLAIGFRNQVTGPASSAGPFSAAGPFDESGANHAEFTIVPHGGSGDSTLEGNQTFEGVAGSLTMHFKGTTTLGGARAIGSGHWRIVAGTGAYADMRGSGRFLVVADFVTLTITGTYEGNARGGAGA